MPVEVDTRFLNVDLLIVGRFDREPLLAAAGDGMAVLHEEAVWQKKKCLVLEVNAPDLDLSRTLARLLKWVERLPPSARRSWLLLRGGSSTSASRLACSLTRAAGPSDRTRSRPSRRSAPRSR